MNWLPLRKYTIPLIDRQADKAVAVYKQLRESILEGDILSIQKMSDFELSIKKRIKEMDEFYNQHCLDQRVRFLQGARMKLSRLILNSTLQQKQMNVNLPWKVTNDLTGSRNSNTSSKKNLTPRKTITPKKQIMKGQQLKANSKRQISKSPILTHKQKEPSLINQQKTQKIDPSNRKVRLQLQIPDDSNNFSFVPQQKPSSKINKKIQQPPKQKNTGRKLQYIPSQKSKNTSNISYGPKPNDQFKEKDGYKITINEPVTHRQSGQIGQNRSQVTNVSGRSRTLTESNANSMKKLNDLIFTIKMTKQQYEDFMEIKQQLNQGQK